MSIPLADALKNVDLEEGKTYKAEIDNKWVVVRVLSSDEYHSAEDWFLGKVVSQDAFLKMLYPTQIVITPDDLTPGNLGDEEEFFAAHQS